LSKHVPESELKEMLKQLPDQLTRWRHLKTGGAYIMVGKAVDSSSLVPTIIYRKFGEPDSIWWTRPSWEFLDGRFKEVDVFEEMKYGHIT
jgi:hypothetical protein